MSDIKLGVLFGGTVAEHEVSLASSRNVIRALRNEKGARNYLLTEIGLLKDGRWVIGDGAHLYLVTCAEERLLPTGMSEWLVGQAREIMRQDFASFADAAFVLRKKLEPSLVISSGRLPLERSGSVDISKLDVVFPVLHGSLGEDGAIQGFFRVAGVPVVSCDVLASAVSMDKIMTNYVLDAVGIKRSNWFGITRAEWKQAGVAIVKQRIAAKGITYPIFVKPANAGSSVGVVKVRKEEDFPAALAEAFRHDRRVVVEQGISGREIELGVLGADEVRVSSVASEIIPKREFYDYEAKYLEDSTEIRLPASLKPEVLSRFRAIAEQAFRAVDGAGMARVDFLYDESKDEIYLNELNTIPGFTNISQYPALMQASGMGYRELIDALIEIALSPR